MSAAETWRPVVGHEGFYEVSDLGRVRSATRRLTSGCCTMLRRHRLLKTYPGGRCNNYRRVMFWQPRRVHAYVHAVVLATFTGPRPSADHVACHRDDVGTNNRADNLYWGTPADNRADFARNHAPAVDPGGYVADEFAGGF